MLQAIRTFIIATMLSAVPACAAARVLSLAEALDAALGGSLAAETAALERSQGKQALAEGVVSALPELSASYATTGASAGELGDEWRFGVALTQPVVDATVILDVMRGFKENNYSRAEAAKTVAGLVLDVQNGYYGLAESQALVASAERQYKRAVENEKTARRRFEVGEANAADRLRAEADALSKETELLSARKDVEDNDRAFCDLIGLADWEEITAEELPSPEEPFSLATTVVSRALLARNPDVAALRAQLRSSDAAYWRAWANLLPALSFSYSHGSTFGRSYPPGYSGSADTRYSLAVSVPLVDVPARVLDIRGARLDRRQVRLELARAELDSRQRLAGLLATQELSFKEWESAAKTVELNEEVYRLNLRGYELGEISLDDLLQVDADLAQAERSRVQATADYWSSRAELNYVLGVSLEER